MDKNVLSIQVMALLEVVFELMLYIFWQLMENQEFIWPRSNTRVQKYPHRTYKDHIGYPASSAASWYKNNLKDIVRKIDFIIADSTAHNKVIEKVKKISYENYFSFHWFYLQAISFINTMFHWYFITMFLICFVTC